MEGKQEGLSVRELLEQAFDALKQDLDGREIDLPSIAVAEIANDSDWHRTRIGYTSYKKASLLMVGDKKWAVAFGTKCGAYPADPYDCDIAAVQLSLDDEESDEQVAVKVHQSLESNDYFRNSLLFSMVDGRLSASKNSYFGMKVLELLKPRAVEFVAQKLVTDPEHFTLDLRPLVKSAIRYKQEFVAFLAETFRTALAE